MTADAYITLVSSLPYLPPFDKAERTPITRLRLEQRLSLLRPEHAEQLERAESLVAWRPSSVRCKSDADRVAQYRALLQLAKHPALHDFIQFRIDQQTILAAMRLRKAELAVEDFQQTAHISRWTQHIIKHWDDADFKLSFMFPWLVEAHTLLSSNDARGLDRLLMSVIWQRLSRISEGNRFGFAAVFAFVFKWDIMQAWFARDPIQAKSRFQEIIQEVRNEH